MSGTILTKCSTEYWANSTGISVCRTYKALFTFTAIGTASYIASVALDVIVRRRQNRLGVYNPMASTTMLGEDPADVKLNNRRSDAFSYDSDPTLPPMPAHHADVQPYNHAHSHSYSNSLDHGHADESSMFLDDGRNGQAGQRVHFSPYEQTGYPHPADQTRYDSGAYR